MIATSRPVPEWLRPIAYPDGHVEDTTIVHWRGLNARGATVSRGAARCSQPAANQNAYLAAKTKRLPASNTLSA